MCHGLFLIILKLPIFHYYPKIEYLGVLITTNNPHELNFIFSNIENNIFRILFYLISLYLFSSFAGFLSWLTIRNSTLDRKLPVFRYPNQWYYILTGEIFDFSKKDKRNNKFETSKNISIRYIDALVQIGNHTFIYSGILHNFMLSKQNTGVDFIKLRNVKRKNVSIDGEEQPFKNIPGEYLLLPFSEIKNINITYYDLKSYIQKAIHEAENKNAHY